MVVFSRIVEDYADEEEVADAVAFLGRSASAPPCFTYEEALKPVNDPPEELPKKSKRKHGKRKSKKRTVKKPSPPLEDNHVNTKKLLTSASSEASLVRGGAYLENLLTMKLQVLPVVDGPLIIDGACGARPSRAEVVTVEDEDSVRASAGRVVVMADGSRLNFPDATASHQLMGSSPRDDDSHHVNQASWGTPGDKGSDNAYGETEVGEHSQTSSKTFPADSYSSGGHQESTSTSSAHVFASASDPGQPGHIYSPEPSYNISSPGKESNADTLSSFTEPGSPSARPDGDRRLADSMSTASYHATSDESTLIIDAGPQTMPKTTQPVAQASPPAFGQGNEVTYIIVNNEAKQPTDEHPSATKGHRTSQFDNVMIPPLSTHLQNMLACGKFSDCQIVLNSAGEMFWSITFNAHRVIIDQNPVLGSLLYRAAALEQSKSPILYLMAGKKFALPRVVEFALQNLYGMPLIDKGSIEQFTLKALGYDDMADGGGAVGRLDVEKMREVAMDFSLCYGAVGAFLNDTRIVQAAFELALESLDWANLEIALHFGIHPEDFLLSHDESYEKKPDAKAKKGNKGKKKKSQKKTTTTNDVHLLPPIHDNLNAEVIQKWAPKLASAAIAFLADNLPSNFLFDRLALSKELQDRIPHHLRAGCSIASLNPNLTGLTFGNHPQPSVNSTRASAILLALPFLHFREFFEAKRRQAGNQLTADLIKAILQEREQRRSHAVREFAKKNPAATGGKKKGKNGNNNKDYPEWFKKELGYREFVIQVQTRDPGGEEGDKRDVEFSLHREWKGNADGGQVIRKFC